MSFDLPGRHKWGRAALSVASAALLTCTAIDGAQQPPSQGPVFRTRTDIVELDVSVLDKDRHPVRGLTEADFTVLEDGKPQPIKVFEAIDVPDREPAPTDWMRDVTPDVTTNEVRNTRLWVVVVDDALIKTTPALIHDSKKIVHEVIDRFGPEDLAAIVFTAHSDQAQDFTSDRTRLLATLDNYNPGFASNVLPDAVINVNQNTQFELGAVYTLRNIMDALIAIPHSHKSLIWVTPGIDKSFIYEARYVPRAEAAQATQASQIAQLDIINTTKQVFEMARRANVAVYPIDPTGLVDPNGAKNRLDFLLATASNTGGKAVILTNDQVPGINAIFQENSSYYLIGYAPTNPADGKVRQLQVKVNRPGLDVRTRDTYQAPKPGDNTSTGTGAVLSRAISTSVPIRELPLRATVAPFAIPGKNGRAAVTIALGVRQPIPDAAGKGRVTVSTDLQVTAFNTEGDNKGTERYTAKVVLRAGAQGDADYEALSRIDLLPGRYRLRLAAYHQAAAKTGTVMVDVTVPDFSRDPASMSGVILAATPGRPSAPRDIFQSVLPLIPTAQRTFEKGDRATALLRLYQNAGRKITPAQLGTRIVDGHGVTVVTEEHTIAPDKFADIGGTIQAPNSIRTAEVQFALPLQQLAPGRYLLTFEASLAATTIRRDVQFEIK